MVKRLAGGYTEALVLLCDISADNGVADVNDLNGQYILKIGRALPYGGNIRYAELRSTFVV
jgi:hypothetical protein